MKFLVVLVAFAMFISVQALTDEQKEKLKDHYKICAGETGAEGALIQRVRTGDFDFEDAKMKSFFLCVFRRIGVMDAEANFNREVALAKVGADVRDKVSAALDICLTKVGDTPEQTAWNYAVCYRKERPDGDFV